MRLGTFLHQHALSSFLARAAIRSCTGHIVHPNTQASRNSLGSQNVNASLPCNADGKNGKDDPNNSETIIVNWLAKPSNYNRWKDDNKTGKSSFLAKW